MKIKFQAKLFLSQKVIRIFLFVIFLFCNTNLFAQEDVTVITIQNARQTEYKKDEKTNNESIYLDGAVEISVQKGDSTSEIYADKITYDRVTKTIFAEGNVSITTKSNNEGGQTTTASSLIMNTSTLEGVFEDGRVVQTQSDALNLPAGSTLIVFSDLFGKTQSNTIAFKNSKLTFCDDDDPHWHIDATRTWLLPGGEFAFFNALLYVGKIPLMYFPAFYYPKDELIFNPVFGFREREGYYVQTTTYLYGRKPLEENTTTNSTDNSEDTLKSLYNFMKPNGLKKQERQGLILHNLDEDYKGDTSNYIKIVGDLYSSLGGMIGSQGKITPKNEYVNDFSYNLLFGFSNTIYNQSGIYLPYNNLGLKDYNKSCFLGLELPFRYSAQIDFSLSKPFNFAVSLPLYSDPTFYKDFMDRKESMDWIAYLTSPKDSTEDSFSELSTLVWKMNGSYSFNISELLKPYVSNASINFNSSVNLSTRTDSSKNYYSPDYKFYYPSLITPISLQTSLRGTLYSYPKQQKTNSSPKFITELNKPEGLLTPEELDSSKKENQTSKENSQNNTEEENPLQPELLQLKNNSYSTVKTDSLNYSLTYSLDANYINQIAYDASSVPTASDFDWSKIKSSMYTLKVPFALSSSLNYANNFFNMTNGLSYDLSVQKHTNMDGYDSSNIKTITYADNQATSHAIINTNSINIKPFAYLPNYAQTGITWNTTLKLFQRKFTGDSADSDWETKWLDDWDNLFLDWSDSDCVTENTLNFTFAANQQNNKFSQLLKIGTTLSPQVPKVTANLNFVFPYVSLGFGTSFNQTSKDDSTWIKNPFTQSLKISLLDSRLIFSQSYSYNLQDSHSDNLQLSCSYKGFSASYLMAYTTDYSFDSVEGWVSKDKTFLPYSISLSYNPQFNTYYKWFNRISIAPSLSTSLVTDLIRPTNSYFIFTPGINFKIHEFMTITFSATSKNQVLYRYVQPMLGYQGRLPGEENIFIDLFDSFNFFDTEKRKSSGFKLKSLNLAINHELHDWDLSMILKFEPRLITKNGSKYYDYNPYFNLSVSWKPMQGIKTQIQDDYGTWKLQ